MLAGPSRWPHRQYTEPARTSPTADDLRGRLTELHDRAEKLQELVKNLLSEPRMPTVLVVEDDPVARRAMEGILTHFGWVVEQAGTVADGLARLEPPPTCVVLDLMLPDGDGSMILRAARSSGLETRFVVMTGVDDPARLLDLAELEPDALLQKPVSVDELCRACQGF